MRVPLDPKSNSRRYWRGPRAAEETMWGYRGAPQPQDPPREASRPPTGPGRKSVGVWGCPLTPGPTQGGIGAAHGSGEQFGWTVRVSRDPWNNSWRYSGVPLAPETTNRAY